MIFSEGRRTNLGEGDQRDAGHTSSWTEKARADSPKSVRTWWRLYAPRTHSTLVSTSTRSLSETYGTSPGTSVWQYLILQMGRNDDYRPSPIPPADLGRDLSVSTHTDIVCTTHGRRLEKWDDTAMTSR